MSVLEIGFFLAAGVAVAATLGVILGKNPVHSLLNLIISLLAVAMMIAWPVSYFYMSEWLNGFPYRETIHWFIFPLAGFVFLILAVLSVLYLTGKAATANPVVSLRNK